MSGIRRDCTYTLTMSFMEACVVMKSLGCQSDVFLSEQGFNADEIEAHHRIYGVLSFRDEIEQGREDSLNMAVKTLYKHHHNPLIKSAFLSQFTEMENKK